MIIEKNEKCEIHTEQLNKMQKDISELKSCLLGTFDRKGFITKIEERVSGLESFKLLITKTSIWFFSIISSGTILGLIGYIFTKKFGL